MHRLLLYLSLFLFSCEQLRAQNEPVSAYTQSRRSAYLKFAASHPKEILSTLTPYLEEPFADSLLMAVTKKYPSETFKFSQNPASTVGHFIVNSKDPYVREIVTLSRTPFSLLYFPFLDDLVTGKKQADDIKKIIGIGEEDFKYAEYFKLLVKTEIDYSKRSMNGDTAVAFFGPNGLRDMLQRKAKEYFVDRINELHDQPEQIRMKCISDLSAEDVYYVLVTNDDEIYTSTYTNSYKRMIERLGRTVPTDSLLDIVNYDYFKKFIKMAANFNKLSHFLNGMSADKANEIMKNFAGGLENTEGLESAADVADAYSSITDSNLLRIIQSAVKENEQRCRELKNKKGETIYHLLSSLFMSVDHADINAEKEMKSANFLESKDLTDEKGRITEQVFFYGDKGGTGIFSAYINSFSRTNWKISNYPEWVEIRSLKEPEILVYVNRPLDNNKNLDDSAQKHLSNFLKTNGLLPSVIIHRGHSFRLPATLDRMPGNAKIVVIGSCGGYKNLNRLVEINPDASIISTKAIGTGKVNQVITAALNEALLSGKPIIWNDMWARLSSLIMKQPAYVRDSWEDYIPPYRNLGALFIKMYYAKTD